MSPAIDKDALLAQLLRIMSNDLNVITSSQQETQAGATHSEAKQESDKDTRATESSYLARGLAKRVTELRTAVSKLSTLRNRHFGEDAQVAMSALIEVEDGDNTLHYYIAPCGGGVNLTHEECKISVVTPGSPLGLAMMGRRLDDEVELRTPQGLRQLCIIGLA